MKKKRNFIKILTFIITLSLTFGFGLILSSNRVSASSNEGQPYLISYVEPGVYTPVNYEPYYDYISQTSTLKLNFTYQDENTEQLIDMKSITMEVKDDIYRLYFNVGNNYNPNTSLLIGYSVANDWVRSCVIIINQKQELPDVELTSFLEQNYNSFIKRGYQIAGRYTFNNGTLINTFGQIFDKEFKLSGYFVTPIKFTSKELNDYFDITDLRAGDYYLSTFNKLSITSSNGINFDDITFNLYLPNSNQYAYISIIHETDQIIWKESFKDIIFDSQIISEDLYEFLELNGTFNFVPEPEEYTPTDLIFAFVDAPIRFLQSLLSFEILGYKFWIIFSSIITLSIAIYLITLKKSGD